MENILLVEDNKSLSKMMVQLIESELDVSVDVAHTMHEAKIFSAGRKYILAILDLNLPDAPNGEIVDFMVNKFPSIVLSGNIDKEFRKKILAKDIIDYVSKGSIEDINYLISTIRRLMKNRNHKVLIVEDSRVFRNVMSKLLKNMFFRVIATAHGEEAIGMLKEHPDTKIVLTDYNMPVMNGLELTKEIRKTFSKNELSIFVLSSSEDDEISAKFLKSGASDYIHKPFSKEEFSCRINNAIEALENIDKIANFSIRDFLTGLYNRRHFYKEAMTYYATLSEEDNNFTIAMIEFENFKSISDRYGHEMGERVLVEVSQILSSSVGANDLVGHFGSGEFSVLLKDISRDLNSDVFERIMQEGLTHKIELENGEIVDIKLCIGATSEYEDDFEDVISKADKNLYDAKNSKNKRIIIS